MKLYTFSQESLKKIERKKWSNES